MAEESKWAGRFVVAAIIQGAIAFAILSVLVGISALQMNPSPGRIVAGGDSCAVSVTVNETTHVGTGTATCSSAGMWFVVGMIGYGLVGVMGIAVSALFYQYLESTLGAPYKGWRNITAWVHLVLGGVGASAATLLMAYGGYMGGAALLPPPAGLGKNAFYVHTNILGPLSPYITALIGLALLGFFVGGVGYVTAWWAIRRNGKAAG
ncbi:MAG: hypothetical protein A3K65_09620 [Euryarchaeota archaeon RBG_16_68_12]|nr:MAG: hypothetical protein A3K65_09620 [Euryarchaeota archaeon RBG_16_68_12]